MSIPLFLQSDGPTTTGDPNGPGAGHPGSLLRKFIETTAGGVDGILTAGGLAVTTAGGLNLAHAAGRAFVEVTTAADQGFYFSDLPAGTLSVAAAHPTLPRLDLIALVVHDSEFAGARADDADVIEVIEGTPASSPAVPTVTDSHIPLASVRLAAGATSVSNLVDLRRFHATSAGIPTFSSLADRDLRWPAPTPGSVASIADIGRITWHDGLKWNTIPATTVAEAAPSGTPAAGDMWITVDP